MNACSCSERKRENRKKRRDETDKTKQTNGAALTKKHQPFKLWVRMNRMRIDKKEKACQV